MHMMKDYLIRLKVFNILKILFTLGSFVIHWFNDFASALFEEISISKPKDAAASTSNLKSFSPTKKKV